MRGLDSRACNGRESSSLSSRTNFASDGYTLKRTLRCAAGLDINAYIKRVRRALH